MTQRISEEQELREQLRQSQKMEALGQLAGSIAHDFNNQLLAIRGYAELVKARRDDTRADSWLAEIIKAADQAGALTRQLLVFSRKQDVQPQLLSLNAVVADTESMLRRLLGEQIEIETALDPALAAVHADPGQVNQVLVNLAVNARDAMQNGGRLTIETTNVTLDGAYARVHLAAEPGEYAMLAVSDTGHGMDAETRARIFEPFFTTKPQGKGTGLGLSIVYGLVRQNGGYLSVYSEPGWGTVFRLYLPAASDTGVQERDVPAPASRVGLAADARILVADDDPGVRGIIETMLAENGYAADIVATADEAVERCRTGDYQLLLTDIVVSEHDGRDLAAHATADHPQLRVLYMSGYTANTIDKELASGANFLAKPFTTRQLLDAIDEALTA